jgi:hypothetical protein
MSAVDYHLKQARTLDFVAMFHLKYIKQNIVGNI